MTITEQRSVADHYKASKRQNKKKELVNQVEEMKNTESDPQRIILQRKVKKRGREKTSKKEEPNNSHSL